MSVRDFLQLWRGNFEIINQDTAIICMDMMDPMYESLKCKIIDLAWFLCDKENNDHIMIIKVDI